MPAATARDKSARGKSPASTTRRACPATTDPLRSNHKGIGARPSARLLSSTRGISLLAPTTTGLGLPILGEDAPRPDFSSKFGISPKSLLAMAIVGSAQTRKADDKMHQDLFRNRL